MTKTEMVGETSDLYQAIRHEMIRLHANWQMFKELYTTSDERMTLLNNTAPRFFLFIQDILVNNAVISLSRLTDPARFNSIPRLIKISKNQIHHNLYEELETDLDALRIKCQDIREHRDKRVAHSAQSSLPPSFDDGPVELPPITRKKIEDALEDSAELLNKFLGHFDSVQQVFEPVVTGGANTLVQFLEMGYEATHPPAQEF